VSGWVWVQYATILAIHDKQLLRHGGASGTRDPGAILSALARPENLAAYGEPDAADLAASYAYGLARNHGFVDGNKRTAWVTARLFLSLNARLLRFNPDDAAETMEQMAAGSVSEQALAEWFRDRIVQP
jgi:death-on-curing protein